MMTMTPPNHRCPRRPNITGGRRRSVTTAILLIVSTTSHHQAVHAYNQNDELSYLTNFDTLTSLSHSELSAVPMEEMSWLTANCINQNKLVDGTASSEVIVSSLLGESTVTSLEVQAQCDQNSHCIIPQSLTLVMNSNLNVGGLTLNGGQLSWTDNDPSSNKYSLCAGYIIAQQPSSLFHMKLSNSSSRGIIYIKNNGLSPSTGMMMMGTRVFGTDMGGNMNVEGSNGMKRTWTLLRDSFGLGDGVIGVLHDVASMGWKVRD
jgi:hypothetical protein